MIINYKSIEDMNQTLIRNLYKFPHDIDLVVGVPRSGMLPANLLALYLNKPFTDIDSFIEGRVYSSGARGSLIREDGSGKVLVVDDTISSGTAMDNVRKKIETLKESFDIRYAVVYATTQSKSKVDYFCEIVDGKRIFQWNLFHHKEFIPKSCFDIDGVLCQNPPLDDDGPVYLDYIKNAPTLYVPSVEIDTLVSCRLEKYRSVTEEWLSKNGIKYKKLVMLDFPDKETRQKWGKHGIYKGDVYKKSDCVLFVESSLKEALDILQTSKKSVFCTENFCMMNDCSVKSYAENMLVKFKQNFYYPIRKKIRRVFFRH